MRLLYDLPCDYYMISHVTISNLFQEFHLDMPKHTHWFKIII